MVDVPAMRLIAVERDPATPFVYAQGVIAATITFYVFLALGVIAFAIEVWGLVDGARRPAQAFVDAEKRTKWFWVGLMIAGVLFGYLSIPVYSLAGVRIGGGLPWLFMLASVLPAAIYLADVKPEVIRFTRRTRRGY